MWQATIAPLVQCCLALGRAMPALASIGAFVAEQAQSCTTPRKAHAWLAWMCCQASREPCVPMPPQRGMAAVPACGGPSLGDLAVAWTLAVMGSGRVRVSMGACMSKAAQKAVQIHARMGLGSHGRAQAVLGNSVKA